jgi:hypothetical protein
MYDFVWRARAAEAFGAARRGDPAVARRFIADLREALRGARWSRADRRTAETTIRELGAHCAAADSARFEAAAWRPRGLAAILAAAGGDGRPAGALAAELGAAAAAGKIARSCAAALSGEVARHVERLGHYREHRYRQYELFWGERRRLVTVAPKTEAAVSPDGAG